MTDILHRRLPADGEPPPSLRRDGPAPAAEPIRMMDVVRGVQAIALAAERGGDPDIVAAALKKSGAPVGRAVMIGDTPYDIEAARRTGIATIALRCGGWDDAHLLGAIAIYDHPRHLLEQLAHSPFCA